MVIALILLIIVLISLFCYFYFENQGEIEGVGILVPATINDQVWGTKGYKGLLQIGKQYDVNVFYREGMDSKIQVEEVVGEFQKQGVNFIIGNGNHYVEIFNEISSKYPNIHFVSVNGKAKNKNTTSVNFEGYAMGYFGGMVAAKMSKTSNLGIIAAYNWQGEIQGFIDGATFQNPKSNVYVKYVGDWDDEEPAVQYVDELVSKDVDVFYPAGDGYNVPVIESVKEKRTLYYRICVRSARFRKKYSVNEYGTAYR